MGKEKKKDKNGQKKKKDKKEKKLASAVGAALVAHLSIDYSSERTLHRGLIAVVRCFHTVMRSMHDSLFTFKELTGGVTNKLYIVGASDYCVIVRIYGEGTDCIIDRDNEITTQLALNACGLAASFYGQFDNGCVYEYLRGVPLSIDSVLDHTVAIAQRLSTWHSAKLRGRPRWPVVWLTLEKWLLTLESADWDSFGFSPLQIRLELNYIVAKLPKSPIVFCHNDALSLNILDGGASNIFFIDYEYAGYNTRGFDIGNHFWEYTGFELELDRYPKRDKQFQFLRAYWNHFYDGAEPSEEELLQLYKEVNVWSLVSHLFWATWAVLQHKHSLIDFDYCKYGDRRFKLYYDNRDKFILLDEKTTDYRYSTK